MKKIIFIISCLLVVNFSIAQSTLMYPDSVVIYNKTTDGTALRVITQNNTNPNKSGILFEHKSLNGAGINIVKSNISNNANGLNITNKGLGSAAEMTNNNILSENEVLKVNNNGLGSGIRSIATGSGHAGLFQTINPGLAGSTLMVQSNSISGVPVFDCFVVGQSPGAQIWLTDPLNLNFGFQSLTYGLGEAGSFRINNGNNTANVITSITGGLGRAGHFEILNVASTAKAVEVESNWSGSSLYSSNIGTGNAGFFEINNSTSAAKAVEVESNGTGTSLYSSNIGTGNAGFFEINNSASTARAVEIKSNGSSPTLFSSNIGLGHAGNFVLNNTSNNGNALRVSSNGTSSSLYSTQSGGGGSGHFEIQSTSNLSYALQGITNGLSTAGFFSNTNTSNTKSALITETAGLGDAGEFNIGNTSNTSAAIKTETKGIGQALLANHTGASGDIAIFQSSSANRARIDKTGKGFFNNGTQLGGADLAESFAVEGESTNYEPGDVLVISTKTDRTIEKSAVAYSRLVAGVYATKPGVLLTENHIDTDLSAEVPMGVVGVIPTKVCNEGGQIQRGDLLVSSSQIGYAMKADPDKIKFGQVLGKALENFDGEQGKIKVLVNVK